MSRSFPHERHRYYAPIFIVMLALLAGGCAAHTNLEPVGKGKVRANASLGGPIVAAFDTHVPIPYLIAGANYGLDEKLDLNGAVHLLSLVYSVAGLDLGATWYPLANDGAVPTLGVGGRFTLLASLKSDVDERFRVYPMLNSSAAWRMGDGLLYTGFDLAIPFTRPDYDTAAAAVIFSPMVGYRWNLSRSLRLFTELKWHGVNIRTDQLATEYIHPGGQGAITPLVAVEWEM